MWRIGVLAGTGTALKRTIPALLGSDLCRVTVVHARDCDRLEAVASMDPSIRLTTSEVEFADVCDQYDVIFIGSPPFLHLRHLQLAVGLGLPVICEKPLIARRDELPELLRLVEGAPMALGIAHQLRHQPAVTDIVELLRSDRLGTPVTAELQWCFLMDQYARSASWKLDPALGGSNAMFDCGVHAIDLAVLFFGSPRRVGAVARRVRSELVCDEVFATLDYPAFTVRVVASQSAAATENDLCVTFCDCVLRARRFFGEAAARTVQIIGGPAAGTTSYEPQDLYRLEVEDFCRSLEGATSVMTSVAEALTTTRILFAIEDAMHTGQFVPL